MVKDLVEQSIVHNEIFMCRQKTVASTKNGKEYFNVTLQDKTGSIDGKVWDTTDFYINDFNTGDFLLISGEVGSFNGNLQLTVRRAAIANPNDYVDVDYFPSSNKEIDIMYSDLVSMINTVNNEYLHSLLAGFFINNEKFAARFKNSTAAKAVHHAFIGGLLEHTLSVANLCSFYCTQYPELNRDLLITAAICHDIGKTIELSPFPENDFTDAGNLLGHIIIGTEMISKKAASIDNFPPILLNELKHCILSHHGELNFGSPKKPALIEAVALSFADNTDAKLQIFKEVIEKNVDNTDWLGFNRFLDSNVRLTSDSI